MKIEFTHGTVKPQVLAKVVETIINSIPMEREDLTFPYMNLEFHVIDDNGELLLDDKLKWKITREPVCESDKFIDCDGRDYFVHIIEEDTP